MVNDDTPSPAGQDDAEGHMPRIRVGLEDAADTAEARAVLDDTSDTEGHMPRIRLPHDDETEDDSEGHMPRIRLPHDEDADDADDAEGHMPNRRAYTETPPPSAVGPHGRPTDPR